MFGDCMEKEFKYYIKDGDVVFKYALGKTEENDKEFHVFNEIILFLEGNAELISENIHTRIEPNTLIMIPKETYHQVVIKGDKKTYRRCTLSFPDMPEVCYASEKAFQLITLHEYNSDFDFLFKRLINLSKKPAQNPQAQLRAILVLVLCEISTQNHVVSNQNLQNELIIFVIEYIIQNLSKGISISDIANATNVSASYLAHIFKKEMNISIYQYIIKKRLALAHRKICDGQLASTAAIECGFNDYSGFYKQYKKAFNRPPSQKN